MTYSKAPLGVEEPKKNPYGLGVNQFFEEFSTLSNRRPPGANSSMMSGRTSTCAWTGSSSSCGSSGAAIPIKK